MSTDFEVIPLDLYQECIDPLGADTHTNMFEGKEPVAYQHACQWTTLYPNSPSDISHYPT